MKPREASASLALTSWFTRLDQVNQFEFGQRTGVLLKFRLKAKRALRRLKCPDELYKSQNEH